MSRRRVTHSGKDRDRDITSLCNPGESWSPRSKAEAIRDIEGGLHSYFVRTSDGKEANVVVAS